MKIVSCPACKGAQVFKGQDGKELKCCLCNGTGQVSAPDEPIGKVTLEEHLKRTRG